MSTIPDERTHYTADGTPITDGLWAWDNNLDLVRIGFADTLPLHSEHFDGWFSVITTGGHQRLQNGDRLGIRHPFTGQLAADAAPQGR